MSWEQVGNAVRFFAFFVESKLGKTGLTVTVDVWNPAGVEVVTAAAATELGDGAYCYELASGLVASVGEYVAVFKTATATVDQQHVPALWVVGRAGVEYQDASIAARTAGLIQRSEPPAASAVADAVLDEALAGHVGAGSAGAALGRIGTGAISAVQPVSANGQVLSLVRGDDYFEDEAREISFSSDQWPSLVGATEIVLTMRRRPEAFANRGTDDVLLEVGDTVASRVVGAGTQEVVFELASADSGALLPGTATGKFDVQAVLASGHVVTLAAGIVTVTEDQTR